MRIRTLFIFLLIMLPQLAQSATLTLSQKNYHNAQTVLLQLTAENITKPKLTLMTEKKFNLNFIKHPTIVNKYYALIPLSYHAKLKRHQIIISYFHNNNKKFKSVKFNVKAGDYKSEKITVKPSKVKPSSKSKERTKREYKEAMDIYNSFTKERYWTKNFIMPMTSQITSPFGTKRVYNGFLKSYHSGTDFRAPTGTPIHAVNAGVVRLASNRYYAGNSVIIDHGEGIYTCYFHLSKIDVKIGQRVKQNEVLGLSGETGRVTGPHLHFSTRVHGVQVDPIQLLTTLNSLNVKGHK